ncbi:hypothetical protein ABT160_16435 [Streptomyces sp. NPDC001941]|uniref:hypothetical protein n=1 Tax=Streptomyces sp. NPDC001941 TaxID=3154659 RepID=UPI0033248772
MNVSRFVRTTTSVIAATLLALGTAAGISSQMTGSDGRTQWADGPVPNQTTTAGNSGHGDTADVTWGN